MSITNKALLALLLAALVFAVIVYAKITAELCQKTEEIARLKSDLSACTIRVRDADAAVERQNAAVEAVRVDTVFVERLIKQTERKYAEVRETVIENIEKDGSCVAKIDNIDFALRRFHGVGVRP
jgi:hypothetical protein